MARQLKRYSQTRLQTLAMRLVRIADWRMVSCPNDAKCRRYWEETVMWRCGESWRDEYVRLSKEGGRPKTVCSGHVVILANRITGSFPFTHFLGDAWIPKLKECNTWDVTGTP